MASTYNNLKDIEASSDHLILRIKVRVVKIWSLSPAEQKYVKPTLELVVMDYVGDRIQCTIRNAQRRLFEDELSEGKIYIVCNFSTSLNDQKYKATNHACRIYFKRDTQLQMVHDPSFSENVFRFVPNDLILNHTNAQSHLIDVIGLLTGKGDIIEFTKNGKKCSYIVLELDDMQGKGKIRCTLWEDFATMLVKHIEEQPTSEYIIIVQFAKFNLFKGAMGISNTNHNSILYINADFQEVKDFRKSVVMAGVPRANQLSQIAAEPAYSMEDDLINVSIYKPISELKASIEQNLALEHSELLTLQTASTDTPKGTGSPSVVALVDNSNDAFSIPKRNIISGGCSKRLIDLYPDSANGSSSKCRKLEDGIPGVDKVYQD
ncbi:uncharacterized protein [Arachis hypogaea]|uniref:uncharacterized protein isoform X4 n=1 Tax=Arachis hypogaea TaxID=3818 RepID=UPI000788183B|nr:uncharacterized protein LOC112706747 isoform X4 [Arachis hypogaea]QHO30887.1 Replication protein A 70 kDa DNA-binding subunit A [Arachis hypogaea]